MQEIVCLWLAISTLSTIMQFTVVPLWEAMSGKLLLCPSRMTFCAVQQHFLHGTRQIRQQQIHAAVYN